MNKFETFITEKSLWLVLGVPVVGLLAFLCGVAQLAVMFPHTVGTAVLVAGAVATPLAAPLFALWFVINNR